MKDKVHFLDELIKHGHEEVGSSSVNMVSRVSSGDSEQNMVNIMQIYNPLVQLELSVEGDPTPMDWEPT